MWGHVRKNDARHMGVELRGISGGELGSSDCRVKGCLVRYTECEAYEATLKMNNSGLNIVYYIQWRK
jgi:hypothetical protein